jgi:hypothetical protein
MRSVLGLALAGFAICGCDKAPEKPKPPRRYMAETQKTPEFVVTIWNKNETVGVGSNVFGLEVVKPDNTPVDPGPVSVLPYLEDSKRTPMPGAAALKPGETAGVYDVFAELPSEGRWKFNVTVGSQRVTFYYNARLAQTGQGRSGGAR